MPKPMKERKTENPLGLKINALMRERGMTGDYAALAKIFDVKTPSVYDWIDHGRLGKERYVALVDWSERSLDWWFDIATPVKLTYERPAPGNTTLVVLHDTNTDGDPPPAPVSFPFQRITPHEWATLPPDAVREIETFALGLIAGRRSASNVKSSNARGGR